MSNGQEADVINETRASDGWSASIHLPKSKALAAHLNKAGCGELAAAADPGSGGDTRVALRHRRTAEHHKALLDAAGDPEDPATAELFASVRNLLAGALAR
jgi:hypothetical protein